MKWKELIKIATEKGYRFYAHGKKHDIYVNDNGERLIVERHGSQEIRKGLMNALKSKSASNQREGGSTLPLFSKKY